jgi:hypothetical protein
MVGLHLSHKETKNNSNDNDYKNNNPVSNPILQKEASNDDGNSKRVFECGCTVEWRLDKIKFTDCIAHSDKGEEVSAVDKVAGIYSVLYQN